MFLKLTQIDGLNIKYFVHVFKRYKIPESVKLRLRENMILFKRFIYLEH